MPPSTAESAWRATRTTLTSVCCAVSVEPAVCVWNRSRQERGSFAPKRSRAISAQRRPGGAELGDLLEEVRVRVEEEGEARREVVDREPARERRLDVGDRVREREGDLLDRRRAGLADVVAGDRDRVPARDLAAAELEDVGRELQRGARREDVGSARDVLLQEVVLDRAGELVPGDARAPARRRGAARAGSTPSS